MLSPGTTKPRRLLHFRPAHAALLLAALVAPLLMTVVVGGRDALSQIQQFPLGLLVTMLAIALLCWNLNAARLRLMLNGRAGTLGQRGALGVELAAKFALCATPGGSGGPVTLLVLLAQRGISPAKGAGVFLIDQGCDLLFFFVMLSGLVLLAQVGDAAWPYQTLIQLALAALAILALSMAAMMGCLPTLLRARRLPTLGLSVYRRRWLTRRLLRCRYALKVTLALPRLTLAMIMGLTAAHWLLRYSLLFLAVVGVGGDISWLWTFLTQMLAMAASQFSFLPGGAGAAEVGVGSLLLPFMAHDQVAAAVLVWRLISYHLYLAAGAPLFMLYSARLLQAR